MKEMKKLLFITGVVMTLTSCSILDYYPDYPNHGRGKGDSRNDRYEPEWDRINREKRERDRERERERNRTRPDYPDRPTPPRPEPPKPTPPRPEPPTPEPPRPKPPKTEITNRPPKIDGNNNKPPVIPEYTQEEKDRIKNDIKDRMKK